MCLGLTADTLDSFTFWHTQHRTRLTNLKECLIQDLREGPSFTVRRLLLPNLEYLCLCNLIVQLEPTADCPGVLHDNTGLTGLSLEDCVVQDPHAAVKAIAALPKLQRLKLEVDWDGLGQAYFADVQQPHRLTVLSLNCRPHVAEELTQLSSLSNLGRLKLTELHGGIPGGVPSQLVKLEVLHVSYNTDYEAAQFDPAEQWQHLSKLTALRELEIANCRNLAAGHLSLERLSELSELKLVSSSLRFNVADTKNWAGLTALERLTLWGCAVEPKALAAFTQLRGLDLAWNKGCIRPLAEVYTAVGKLPLLTHLSIRSDSQCRFKPAVFKALTANSQLQSFKLAMAASTDGVDVEPITSLFEPCYTYPHLRVLHLHSTQPAVPTSMCQLWVLSMSCPAVEDLGLALGHCPPKFALQPLQNLSALTFLQVVSVKASAAAAVVEVAAQLTGLKALALLSLPDITAPSLLKLTALTALKTLFLGAADEPQFKLQNTALPRNPPDVWIHLLRHLLRNAAFCKALLERSSAAAAAAMAPAELDRLLLAVKIAEELAQASAAATAAAAVSAQESLRHTL